MLDRYLLRQMLRPLLISLGLVLPALVLERILRLVDMVVAHGGPLASVLTMAASLLPHYLALALPAAFFLSILTAMGRLASDSEIDAILSSGLSVHRLVAPFVVVGLALALVTIVLSGYVQPHARYGYRAEVHTAKQAAWIHGLSPGQFFEIGEGMTFYADAVDRASGSLSEVFIHETKSNGDMVTTTARYGRVVRDSAHPDHLKFVLLEGRRLNSAEDGSVLEFEVLTLDRDFSLKATQFRPRGRDERELTLGELYHALAEGDGPVAPHVLSAELHGRLVRAASMSVLPLLALPMGMAAKRGRRGAGVLVAALLLVVYHHTLQMGESLVEVGRLAPGPVVWMPFAAFTGLGLWVLWRANGRSGRGPFDDLLASAAGLIGDLRYWLGRWRRRRA